jgi:hypothetical protein
MYESQVHAAHTMTGTEALVAIFADVVSVGVAIFNRKFYWRKGWLSGDKEAPHWIGRLLFGVVGVLLILVGFRFFLLGY